MLQNQGPMMQAWGSQAMSPNHTVVDNAPQDMLYMIDPHWYQYPPMNPLYYSLLAFVLVIACILAVSGNFVVIYVFMTTKSLRTPSNLYIVNLAFSDFMTMITMSPIMIFNCMYETWMLGPLMCEVYGAVGSIFGCGSIWSMILIAGDRYNVICKGMAAKPLTTKIACVKIMLVWLWVIGWTLPPFFGWNRYVPEGNLTACGTDYLRQDWMTRSYLLCYGFAAYLGPFLKLVYSYFFIVKSVCDHEKQMREQAKKMNVASLRSSDANKASAEARLAKIALMTCTLWFVAWTPYAFINFVGVFDLIKLTPVMTIWASVFAKCNAIYNPIVYGISHPKYRAALYVKFPCLNCATGEPDDSKSISSGQTTCDSTAKD